MRFQERNHHLLGDSKGTIMLNRNKEKDIFKALRNGEIEKIKALIDSGIDVNVQDKNGSTALMWASHKGYIEAVKALIEAKAEADAHAPRCLYRP